jgi:hypothetical protein
MAKTKISEFDTNPALNTDIDSINIAEGCAPSGINNAIRELMSQLKNQQDGSSLDTFTVGNTLTVNAANSLRLADTDSSHYVGLKSPGTVSTSYTLTLPTADGTSGQVISTNGSGALSFISASSGDVTLTGTQTLTNKTIEAGTFTNGYTEEVATANTSTAYTIDLANGSVQILTLTGNCVYTFPTPVAGKSFILIQKQDATGSRTVTWPASVDWPSATAPTLTATASKADKFVFTAIDGSNWLGSVAGQNYTV